MLSLPARTVISNPWLWLDLETTDLDPKTSRILSLGFILTDSNLVEYARAEYVLGMTGSIREALFRAPQIVRDMHEKSGLLARMEESDLSLVDVVADVQRNLDVQLGDSNPANLAGNTVHFDRSFLYEWAPSLLRYFSHRHLDVSVFKVLANAWGIEPFPKSSAENRKHTPISDLEHSLEEFRHWRWHMLRDSAIPFEIRKADGRPYIDAPPPRE
jgi:oligoribonuclease